MMTPPKAAQSEAGPPIIDEHPVRPLTGTPKLIVIAGRCGRLANRLVLFANFIAFAEERGHRVMNPTFHSYAKWFKTTRRDIYCQYPVPRRRSWLDVLPGVAGTLRGTRLFFRVVHAASGLNEHVAIFGRGVVTLRQAAEGLITELDGPYVQGKIRDARIVLVNGWNFRAPELVQRHAERIRSYFQPIEPLQQASLQTVHRLRQHADVVVGVHIRRNDYRTWRDGKCFFAVSRYASWMAELAEQFPACKTSFLVCSDEPRDAGEFPGLSVGFGPGSPVADLCALAQCDYIFGPISTFSQWASFYGNKPLFHLRDGKDVLERASFSVSDLREVP